MCVCVCVHVCVVPQGRQSECVCVCVCVCRSPGKTVCVCVCECVYAHWGEGAPLFGIRTALDKLTSTAGRQRACSPGHTGPREGSLRVPGSPLKCRLGGIMCQANWPPEKAQALPECQGASRVMGLGWEWGVGRVMALGAGLGA